MKRGLLVAISALAVVLAAGTVFAIMSAGAQSLPPQTGAVEPQPLGNGQFRFFPRSGRVNAGVPYRFRLYTHCGLDWPLAVDFDGTFWDPIGPGPASDGSGNPPAGYGNPYDRGMITLVSPTLAQYRSDSGAVLQWNRHAGPQISSPCS
jgi:hypothetical protein